MGEKLRELHSDFKDFQIEPTDLYIGDLCESAIKYQYFTGFIRGNGLNVLIQQSTANFDIDKDLEGFYNMVKFYSTVNHPTILKFQGFYMEPYTLITEMAVGGNLLNYIQTSKTITGTQLTIIAAGIAAGINEMHKNRYVHRNLQPGNILLDDSYEPKIFRFDNVFEIGNRPAKFVAPPFIGWYPLEQIDDKDFSEKSDQYSFGMILYYMFMRKMPFGNNNKDAIIKKLRLNQRPKINKNQPKSLIKLIESCWDQFPAARPSFETIFAEFASGKVAFPGADEQLVKNYIDKIITNTARSKLHKTTKKINTRTKINDSDETILSNSRSVYDSNGSKKKTYGLKTNVHSTYKTKNNKVDTEKMNPSSVLDNRFRLKTVGWKRDGETSLSKSIEYSESDPYGDDDDYSVPVRKKKIISGKYFNDRPRTFKNQTIVVTLDEPSSKKKKRRESFSDDNTPIKKSMVSKSFFDGSPGQFSNKTIKYYSNKPDKRKKPLDFNNLPKRKRIREVFEEEEEEITYKRKPVKKVRPVESSSSSDPSPNYGKRKVQRRQEIDDEIDYVLPKRVKKISAPPLKTPIFTTNDIRPGAIQHVGVNLKYLTNYENQNFMSELKKAETNLAPSQYETFFKIIDQYFTSQVPSDIINSILSSLSVILNNNDAIEAFAECGTQFHLPLDDPELLSSSTDVLAQIFAFKPEIFQANFQQTMQDLINLIPSKAIHLLALYAKRFDQIHNPWALLDLLISNWKVFFRSSAASDYIKLLCFLNTQNAAYVKARFKACRPLFTRFLESSEKLVRYDSYKAIGELYDKDFELPYDIIAKDLKDQYLIIPIMSILVRAKNIPVSKEILFPLLNIARTKEEASKIILKLMKNYKIVEMMIGQPKWMNYQLPTYIYTLKFLSMALNDDTMIEVIVTIQEMYDLLAQSLSSETISFFPNIMEKISKHAQVSKKLEATDFYSNFREVTNMEPRKSLKMLYILISNGYVKSFVKFASFVVKYLQREKTQTSALFVINLMSSYRPCATKLIELDALSVLKNLSYEQEERAYVKETISNLKGFQ